MKLLSYDEEGELNARLHIIDGGKLPITHTIDFFEYVNMENTAVYPLTYNKVLITYTDMEEDIHRLDIFNLDTKKVIYTMEESKEKMGEVVFKHKLYIFYTDHTVIYDISTNTTSEIKIENMPDVTDLQIYIINNKIIANYIDTLIYEIDVENGKAILIYKSDDIENNFGFYNGETLIITEGSFMKITNKAKGNR